MMARTADDWQEPPEKFIPPIDHRDADILDPHIAALPDAHKDAIRREYYLHRNRPDWIDLGAAKRALQDHIEAARHV